MITRSTVLVLGAGASVPYGFPSGEDLLKEITSYPERYAESIRPLRFGQPHIDEFVRELSRSNAPSVDTFLGYREKYRELGKAAIASLIMSKESPEHCLRPDNPQNWYRYLYQQMLAGASSLAEFRGNKLAIVTFNYDRSFEFFLRESVKALFEASSEDASTALRSFPIIHVHGLVGSLPGYPSDGASMPPSREYETDNQGDKLLAAIEGIRVLHEAQANSEEFAVARRYLAEAEQIFFIGNAYHDENIRRLHLQHYTGPQIIGSALGLTDGEKRQAINRFPHDRHPELASNGLDALGFLRAYTDRLST